MPRIVYVHGDDWVGVYVDGKLKAQNHILSVIDVLNVLEVDYDVVDADIHWLDEVGQLPENLADIVQETCDES